ncbi:hypothetical protein MVES_000355 [Malassezia vespertilionis]|uniref:Ino eighty subunit 1 n=1 Tax=Malassezia vespertilionis TaxID=2020962 RepID=A0A2N1JH48_9BASI|nr:hypothetical protein MVES_000355 [Malassezia vespertilionis]
MGEKEMSSDTLVANTEPAHSVPASNVKTNAADATHTRSSQLRNQPVKRYDGEPLTRTDVQHAVLCYLFADTRRVFTNPRPGPRGAPTETFVVANNEDLERAPEKAPAVLTAGAAALSGTFPTPVWPFGQSHGSARRSNETQDEFEAWKQRRTDFLQWRDANYPASITPTGELPAPHNDAWQHPGSEKLTFKELYIEALINSSKCTKSMREKCVLDEEYAEDFSKVCLLVNVGRINTTLAFYPEMKTILRSYHPVPSLQKSENTRRNMQDAPRMKSLLKAVLLPHERPGPPGGVSTASAAACHANSQDTEEVPADLAEIARRARRAPLPPTSVVTLIFLLTQQTQEVTALHFPQPYDIYSLFFPQSSQPVSAKQRADAFLWLLYHYLEGPVAHPPGTPGCENPFDDAFARESVADARRAWLETSGEPLTDEHPLWRGVANPDYARWKEENEAEGVPDGADAAKRGKKAGADAEVFSDASNAPKMYTHRILVPAFTPITPEAAALEDEDTREEIEWGRQMQEERAAFLVRFQEEEQAKVLAQNGMEAFDVDQNMEDTKSKKRIHPGTQSCYPLANILANAAAAGSHSGALARSPIGFVKRARLSSRQLHKDSRESSVAATESDLPGTEHSSEAKRTSLWHLRLDDARTRGANSMLHDTWSQLQAQGEEYDSDIADFDDPRQVARALRVLRTVREMRNDVEAVHP